MNWFEVVAIAKEEDNEVVDVEGSHVYIRGEIGDMLVIQIPTGIDHQNILQGVQRMLDSEGIEKGVFVIDQDIQMMKLEPVEENKARVMEEKYLVQKMQKCMKKGTLQ